MSAVLSLQNIHFAWSVDAPELLHIDVFTVARGEKVSLHGASGSGKTTLLNLASGVLLPQQGQVQLLDHELTQLRASERDRIRGAEIGYIFQMFNLLPAFTVLENVCAPCFFSASKRLRLQQQGLTVQDAARELLAALQLDPQQLATRRVSRLSVGQQQRVAAARALIGAPALIIADEPTSALDRVAREQFLDLLFAQCQKYNTALLLVSHDDEIGARFDRCVALASINRVVGA